MSIFVCSEAGADILQTIVSKKFRQDIVLVSTCVATKNPGFRTCEYSFPKRLRNLTDLGVKYPLGILL